MTCTYHAGRLEKFPITPLNASIHAKDNTSSATTALLLSRGADPNKTMGARSIRCIVSMAFITHR